MAGGPKGITWLERSTSLFLAFATCFTCVFGLIAAAVTLKNDVDSVKATAVKIDTRVQTVEHGHNEVKQDMREMKTDIGWIRQFLERRP